MSNTVQRIVSALVMIAIVVASVLLGTKGITAFLFIVGIVINDELCVNFFRRSRTSLDYLLMQLIFIIPFSYFGFLEYTDVIATLFNNAALAFCLFLAWYLFFTKMKSHRTVEFFRTFSYLAFPFTLLPLMSMVWIANRPEYVELLVLLCSITWAMDTGAWFFGINFGKRKLWPEVSPKKSVEGLIGGMLCSGVVGSVIAYYLLGKFTPHAFIAFMILGCLAQAGDLVQSKLKRQFRIKDSSNLIPGHGGVYDRVDSLLFLTPFFVLICHHIL